MNEAARLTLAPVTIANADPEAKGLLEEAQRRMGFVPNMYGFMANSPGLLETYVRGQARFRQKSGLTPPEQEVVLLTISRENGCLYCMAAHSVIADNVSKVPGEVTEALRERRAIGDKRLAALAHFTEVMLRTRGMPERRDIEAFFEGGFGERHVLEIVLAIAVKTISNYTNHLFHTPLDEKFKGRAWEPDETEAAE